MTAKKQKHIIFEKGTGNVFADIGFANSEREQLKAHLTLQIYRIFKDRHLTQAQAGASEYGRVTNPICRRHFVEQLSAGLRSENRSPPPSKYYTPSLR